MSFSYSQVESKPQDSATVNKVIADLKNIKTLKVR